MRRNSKVSTNERQRQISRTSESNKSILVGQAPNNEYNTPPSSQKKKKKSLSVLKIFRKKDTNDESVLNGSLLPGGGRQSDGSYGHSERRHKEGYLSILGDPG